MAAVTNIHERQIAAPAEVVGSWLDRMGGVDDVLWPAPGWTPMVLDGPLVVGTDAGHGSIRYRVSAVEPGGRIRFDFHPALGLDGYHEARVTPADDDRCVLRHEMRIRPRGRMRVLWPLAIRWLHDALIEDLLDNAEQAASAAMGTPPPTRSSWPPSVRLLRLLERAGATRAVAVPAAARLARDPFPPRSGTPSRIDFSDAFEVVLPPDASADPAVWADAIFFDPPRWVGFLLQLRNVLVRAVGIEPGDESAFATVATTADEVLLGTDAGHLDFRASVLVGDRAVTLSTMVRVNNLRGRCYMAVVRRVHPVVVRSMLARAARRLAARPTAGSPAC